MTSPTDASPLSLAVPFDLFVTKELAEAALTEILADEPTFVEIVPIPEPQLVSAVVARLTPRRRGGLARRTANGMRALPRHTVER